MNGLVIPVFALLAVWPWSSTKEYHMTPSNDVPAAVGVVKVQKDKENGNTKIDVKVTHLANPSNLRPSADAYIVWVQPGSGNAVKQGAIRMDKNLKGELNVVTVSKDFDLFITAEQSESVPEPSGVKVLRTHVSLH